MWIMFSSEGGNDHPEMISEVGMGGKPLNLSNISVVLKTKQQILPCRNKYGYAIVRSYSRVVFVHLNVIILYYYQYFHYYQHYYSYYGCSSLWAGFTDMSMVIALSPAISQLTEDADFCDAILNVIIFVVHCRRAFSSIEDDHLDSWSLWRTINRATPSILLITFHQIIWNMRENIRKFILHILIFSMTPLQSYLNGI